MTRKTYFVIFCGALSILLALLARTTFKQAFLYTIHHDAYDHSPVLYGLWNDHLSHLLDRRALIVHTSFSGDLAGILFDESLQDDTLTLGDINLSLSMQRSAHVYTVDAIISGTRMMGDMSGATFLKADLVLSGGDLFLRLGELSLSTSSELPYLISQWYTIGRLRKDRRISLTRPERTKNPQKLLGFLRPRIQIVHQTPPYIVFSGTHDVSFPGRYPSGILLGSIILSDLGTIHIKSDRSLGSSLPMPDVSHSLTIPDIIDAVGMDSDG